MGNLTSTVLIGAAFMALAAPLIVWAFFTRSVVDRRTMLTNLQRQLHQQRPGEEMNLSAAPSSMGSMVTGMLPSPLVRNLDRLHRRAGRPARWPMERILVSKVLLVVAGVVVGALLWRSQPSITRFLIALVVAAFIAFLPEMLLSVQATRRRDQIALKLPDMMDQLSIAVEAGLGFEGALAHVARNTAGPLSDEVVRTLQDIQVGVPRKVAYQSLGDRIELPDLRRFLRAIIQAEEHGISVARVLSIQASEMRITRRLRAEEKAMRIPVLVALPLFLCIFPALLVVVLGPAVINIIEAFTGGLVGPPGP